MLLAVVLGLFLAWLAWSVFYDVQVLRALRRSEREHLRRRLVS